MNIIFVGRNLDSLVQLGYLNLAGNHLSSFKDLTHLVKLPALKDLSLKVSLNILCCLIFFTNAFDEL